VCEQLVIKLRANLQIRQEKLSSRENSVKRYLEKAPELATLPGIKRKPPKDD
jgi:hypothetical protein